MNLRLLVVLRLLAVALAWGGVLAAPARGAEPAAAAAAPAGRCAARPAAAPAAPAATPAQARAALRGLVQQALDRHPGMAAARLLAEAAMDDLRQAEAARQPQAAFNASAGPNASHGAGRTETSALQWRGGVTVNQLLYDGGRSERMIDVRRLQADAMRLARMSQQDQLALATLSAAYELNRFGQQAQVWADYADSAACLVASLEQVVAADRGRLSELVQARKSLAQVQLSLAQAAAQRRQAELRLARYVGDERPAPGALDALLVNLPDLSALLAEAERAYEIEQLRAQAGAADALAESTKAALRPQLVLSAGLNQSSTLGGSLPSSHGGSANLGLALSIPLLDPGTHAAVDAARRRAQAARLQTDDALDSRRARIADLHDQARAAFERARLTDDILRDSERLRDFTLQQWQQLGRRSLFDVMATESEHFNLRVARVNAQHDGQQINALLRSLGRGLLAWLE